MVPILPVFFGAKSVFLSWLCGGIMALIVTAALSFISGMRVRRRILTNLTLVTIAVAVAYAIGILVKDRLGTV
jgi:VIT1/CCC1 family predicted Fe2+/Mn2+ transporter